MEQIAIRQGTSLVCPQTLADSVPVLVVVASPAIPKALSAKARRCLLRVSRNAVSSIAIQIELLGAGIQAPRFLQ